ncbi:MAG: MFS transporter [Clostridiales bacterium]|nr:MFS transporter [Clostridiales bacterium]
MESNKTKTSLFTFDYIVAMIGNIGTNLVNSFFFPTLPLYMEMLTGTAFYGGMMTAMYSVAALASRPVSGALSDRFGRVKLLVLGTVICAVSCGLYGATTSVVILLGIRALNGLGFGINSTCSGAVVADVVPNERLSEGIGYFGLFGTIIQAAAPGIALAIVAGGEVQHFRSLFTITTGICVFSVLVNSQLRYERRRKQQQSEKGTAIAGADEPETEAEPDDQPPSKTILGYETRILPLILVLTIQNLGQSGIMGYLTLFAKWKGIENVGLYFTFSACGVFCARLMFSKIADRRSADLVIIPGLAGLALCHALLPFTNSTISLVAMAIPMGLCNGAVAPTLNSTLFKRCSPRKRGAASGAYYTALDIGNGLGALVLGAIADATDYRYVYWTASVLVALSLVAYILSASDKRYNAKHAVKESLAP